MRITIGPYELDNDLECKCIPDGFEIFGCAVRNHGIDPEDFVAAYYLESGSIIVEVE